jgi:hypothetical protein
MTPNPFEDHDPVEDLLIRFWYPSLCAYRPNLGTGQCSPMFRDTQNNAGNVYHDDSDAADAADRAIHRIIAKSVEACVDALPTWQMRVAVELHAANRSGAHVWGNARMSPDQLLEAWQEARILLQTAFAQRELLEKVAKMTQPSDNPHRGRIASKI